METEVAPTEPSPVPLFEQVAEPDTRSTFERWLEDPAPQTWFHFEQDGYDPKKNERVEVVASGDGQLGF